MDKVDDTIQEGTPHRTAMIVAETAPDSSANSPRAYKFREFCERYRVNKDAAYEAIRDGHLIARKRGKLTLILHEDADNYIASLPRLKLLPREGRS